MRKFDYRVADVFSDAPLKGNPVAVFLDSAGMTASLMQQISREMHLSETVFVLPPENGGDVRVRIFTPVNELPFAGHPTLGTAIVLGESSTATRICMETAMGMVPFDLERDTDGSVCAATMWQPIPTWKPYERADELLAALGLTASTQPIEVYRNGPRHVFVGLSSISELSKVDPDHRMLARLPDVAVNCFAGADDQWQMRMFSPAYGVVEDAATGSAAGPLAIHLCRHGLSSFGQHIEIHQGVEMGRHSTMRARAIGSEKNIESVEVGGAAVIIIRGSLNV